MRAPLCQFLLFFGDFMRNEYDIAALRPRANPYLPLALGSAATQELPSIPSMVESILSAEAEPIESCTPYDPSEEW